MRRLFKYGLVTTRGRQLLVVRERGTSKYILPGGRPHRGESAENTLAREIGEELNASLKLDSIRHYGTFEDMSANESSTIIQISVFLGEVEGDLTPSSEIEEIAWIGSNHKLLLSPSIENKILPTLVRDGIVL